MTQLGASLMPKDEQTCVMDLVGQQLVGKSAVRRSFQSAYRIIRLFLGAGKSRRNKMRTTLSITFLCMITIHGESPKWTASLQNIKAETGWIKDDSLVVNEVGRVFISFDQKIWNFRGISIGTVKENRHDIRFLSGQISDFKILNENKIEFSGKDDLSENSREPKFRFKGYVIREKDKVRFRITVDKGTKIRDVYKDLENHSAVKLSNSVPIYFGE